MLYTLYKMYIHVYGMSCARNSKIYQGDQMACCGCGLECKLRRARFQLSMLADNKTSVNEECSTKLMKKACFHKNQVFRPGKKFFSFSGFFS